METTQDTFQCNRCGYDVKLGWTINGESICTHCHPNHIPCIGCPQPEDNEPFETE
jgi:hypothetical protein